jgi:hypothetical protein
MLSGDGGFDFLSGGLGDDELLGEAGPDDLGGGRGNDRASGGDRVDFIEGGLGDDRLSGQRDADDLVEAHRPTTKDPAGQLPGKWNAFGVEPGRSEKHAQYGPTAEPPRAASHHREVRGNGAALVVLYPGRATGTLCERWAV